MQLAAGISTYYDRAGLKRTLDSLRDFDYVFVIFGRYPHFSELPDDGSIELIKSYSNTVLTMLDADEPTKRNAYLQNVDYLLVIDSDEYLEGDISEFKQNLAKCTDSIHGVSYWSKATGTSMEPRLWYKPYEMEYYQKHNIFRNKATGQIYHSGSAAKTAIEGIVIKSDDSQRSWEHSTASEQYQAWLRGHERGEKPEPITEKKQESPVTMWCYSCKQGVSTGYVTSPNGVTECPLCKVGKLTRHRHKIYRDKTEAPLDPKYIEQAKNTKFKYAAGIIFYQDRDSLKRTLDSITPQFDRVYCIDGRWRDYPAPNDLSTDGSRELVQSYPNTILEDAGGLLQPEKRNRYFELARKYKPDIMMLIDSDEWIEGDFEQWKLETTARCLSFSEPKMIDMWFRASKQEPHVYTWQPRLCFMPYRFTLQFNHHTHFDIERGHQIESVNGSRQVVIMHNDELRHKDWTERQTKHDLWQLIYEMQKRCHDSPKIRKHVEKHGFDAVGILLENNPDLTQLINDFRLPENARPNDTYLANPEYKDIAEAVRRWMGSS